MFYIILKELVELKKWTIDNSHTDASFAVKHMGIMNVRGSFKAVTGFVETDDNNMITKVSVKVDVTSIATRDKDRDGHLLSEDFFFADKFPSMDFVSTKVLKIDNHSYEITGNLTLRGVTKEITLDVLAASPIKDLYGLQRIALEGTSELNRQDFGLKWNQVLDNGGLLVGNKVKLNIESEVTFEG